MSSGDHLVFRDRRISRVHSCAWAAIADFMSRRGGHAGANSNAPRSVDSNR